MMLRYLLRRPIAVLVTTVGLLCLSIFAGTYLPVSLLPDIPSPEIIVQVEYPGVDNLELERQVVEPLRRQLQQLESLEDIRSVTRNGFANIYLQFRIGTSDELTLIEVNEKLDQTTNFLPREVPRPQVYHNSASDVPIVELIVYDSTGRTDFLNLSQLSRSVLKRRLEQLETVTFSDLDGYALPEIRITPNEQRLQTLGIEPSELGDWIRASNVRLSDVQIEDGNYRYGLRVDSELKSVRDVETVRFRVGERILRLSDVARVELVAAVREGGFWFNQHRAVRFTLHKSSTDRVADLKREVDMLLRQLRLDYPNLQFRLINDASEILTVAIENLWSSLGYGVLFAALILYGFVRRLRDSVIMLLVIPGALTLALLGFYLFNLSINIISLSGLIFGVGLTIDNAIIVLDNIRQHRQTNEGLEDAVVHGVTEVVRPLVSSTLTTLSVFVPLIFLRGVAGVLFFDQAVSIAVAMMCSLAFAFVVLPVLYFRSELRKPQAKPAQSLSFPSRTPSVPHKWKPVWTTMLFLLPTGLVFLFLYPELPVRTFPQLTKRALVFTVDWNEPVSVAENERRSQALLTGVAPQYHTATVAAGRSQFLLDRTRAATSESRITAFTDQSLVDLEIAARRWMSKQYPTAKFAAEPQRDLLDNLLGNTNARVLVEVRSNRSRILPAETEMQPLLDLLEEADVPYRSPPVESQILIYLRADRLERYGVDHSATYQKLRTLFGATLSDYLQIGEEYLPIRVSSDQRDIQQILETATIRNRSDRFIPLRELIRVDRQTGYKEIMAGRAGPFVPLALETWNDNLLSDLQQVASNTSTQISFSGSAFEDRSRTVELRNIILLALLLLYLILSAQFESLVLPLIVLVVVPVSIGGAVLLLYLTGESVNVMSMIGAIVLSGIVVNDAILKVDIFERARLRLPLSEALKLGNTRRLRPILMTSATTVLALLPMLFSEGIGAELQRPLTLAVIGGLTFGTVASVFLVPALYQLLRRDTR